MAIDLPKIPATPECDKVYAFHDDSQIIGDFIEWLSFVGIHLIEWEDEIPYPVHEDINHLLARFFDIDLNKVEQERRDVLDFIRNEGQGE